MFIEYLPCELYRFVYTMSCIFIVLAVADFKVVAQSKDVIIVRSMSDAVCLYCISSKHEESTYTWKKLGSASTVFPNTPVLYVKGSGLYECRVSTGLDARRMFVTSHVFSIDVQPGTMCNLHL